MLNLILTPAAYLRKDGDTAHWVGWSASPREANLNWETGFMGMGRESEDPRICKYWFFIAL